ARCARVQSPLHYGADVQLQRPVRNVTDDARLRLQLEVILHRHLPVYGAVHNHIRHADVAVDARLFADHQGRRFTVGGDDIAFDVAVDAQTAGECDVAVDDGSSSDQAPDPSLGSWFV